MIRTINVTQGHIDAGIRGDCAHCPVAIAICEHLRARVYPMVGEYRVRFCQAVSHATLDVLPLPAVAYKSIRRLDHDGHIAPFSFDLDIPDELLAEATEWKHEQD